MVIDKPITIPTQLAEEFQTLLAKTFSSEPEWLKEIRKQAFHSFCNTGLPSRKNEEYKYGITADKYGFWSFAPTEYITITLPFLTTIAYIYYFHKFNPVDIPLLVGFIYFSGRMTSMIWSIFKFVGITRKQDLCPRHDRPYRPRIKVIAYSPMREIHLVFQGAHICIQSYSEDDEHNIQTNKLITELGGKIYTYTNNSQRFNQIPNHIIEKLSPSTYTVVYN
jgi:hypothetical protein